VPIDYYSPGVYVVEEQRGARPIGAVGTSTVGLVGVAPNAAARPGEAVGVSNWSDFLRVFGPETGTPTSTPLSRAVYGFFDNGGGRCYVVNIGEGDVAGSGTRRGGVNALEAVDEVAIVAAPGYFDAGSQEALLAHCEKLGDRVAILDPPLDVTDISQFKSVATAGTGRGRRSGDEDLPSGDLPGLRPRQSDYGAFYFPWLVVRDPFTGQYVETPPSGHIAGVWARNDNLRGVHKAPANEPVRGATDLTYRITKAEQDELNPIGVNCVRYFPAEGIRVWGARTLAAQASEWRYLNVRRLFNMLKESIAEGTRWIVFEPNDAMLWRSIRRDIGAFLTRVWRDGALFGATPRRRG
jgi:phage tail sheath protein FI